MQKDSTVIKVTDTDSIKGMKNPAVVSVAMRHDGISDEDAPFFVGDASKAMNDLGDLYKRYKNEGELLSGVHNPETAKANGSLNKWVKDAESIYDNINNAGLSNDGVRQMTKIGRVVSEYRSRHPIPNRR